MATNDRGPPAETKISATNSDTTSNYRSDGTPVAVPPGSKRTGGNKRSSVWTAPDGTWYAVLNDTGELDPTFPNGSTQAASGGGSGVTDPNQIKGVIQDLKNQLDSYNLVGTPGFGGDPKLDAQRDAAFKQLQDAATAFGANYSADRANAADARATDLQTIADLRAAAEGRAPSAAEALMRKSIDQNANQALGLAATIGGNNPGMALRAGLQAQSEAGAKSAADIAAMRANEMAAARQLLAEQTAKGRATDLQGATNTGGQFAGIVTAPYEALTREKAAEDAKQASLIQTGGTIAAASSDVTAKKNIQPAPEAADAFLSSLSPEERTRLQVAAAAKASGNPYVKMEPTDEFLSTLKPQQFEYKRPDKNKPAGKRIGVMAQDLPKHDVVTGPDGKKWISADVISDVLAGMGRLHERTTALEGANQPPANPMQQPTIPREAVHEYLSGLGIEAP